jgi:hypothetical protein
MPFTAALHTYFTISDVARFHVRGLAGCSYTDSLRGRAQEVEGAEQLRVGQEVDRIYLQAPDLDVKVGGWGWGAGGTAAAAGRLPACDSAAAGADLDVPPKGGGGGGPGV